MSEPVYYLVINRSLRLNHVSAQFPVITIQLMLSEYRGNVRFSHLPRVCVCVCVCVRLRVYPVRYAELIARKYLEPDGELFIDLPETTRSTVVAQVCAHVLDRARQYPYMCPFSSPSLHLLYYYIKICSRA